MQIQKSPLFPANNCKYIATIAETYSTIEDPVKALHAQVFETELRQKYDINAKSELVGACLSIQVIQTGNYFATFDLYEVTEQPIADTVIKPL